MANVDFGRIKRYFWDLMEQEPSNDDTTGAPVWLLGRQYDVSPKKERKEAISKDAPHTPPEQERTPPINAPKSIQKLDTPPESVASSLDESGVLLDKSDEDGGGWGTQFLDDFESRIWMTYRSKFLPIPKSQNSVAASSMSLAVRLRSQLGDSTGFTSDTGWGCMIRTGQSLLANALVIIRFGREWRRGQRLHEEKVILSLFADDPRAPYSIHKFVEHGAEACGKHPGEWFGPSATARCIEALSNERDELRVYITGDGPDVYEDTFMKIAKPDGITFKPTIVLVGTRLGIDKVNPVYWEALKSALQMPQSLGIAGGRPSSSHYFVGNQGPYIFYLDPHHTRVALPLPENIDDYTEADVDSCHTRRLRRLHIKEMDPSMLISFLIRDEKEWAAWRTGVSCVQGKAVIHVADKAPGVHGTGVERDGAVDEVESCDDETDDETVLG